MIASKNYEILKFNKMCVQVGYLKLQNITEGYKYEYLTNRWMYNIPE